MSIYNTPTHSRLQEIVNLISAQIAVDLACLNSEERHPSGNADASDDTIKELRTRIDELRKLRIVTEDIFVPMVTKAKERP